MTCLQSLKDCLDNLRKKCVDPHIFCPMLLKVCLLLSRDDISDIHLLTQSRQVGHQDRSLKIKTDIYSRGPIFIQILMKVNRN